MEEQPEPDEPGYFSQEYGEKKSWWTDEYKLARKHLYGSEDFPPDPVRARELLQSEADKGNGLALYDLGLMARNGFGCAEDSELAQERFRKALAAFRQEESRSKKPGYWQYRIGKMYAMGYGAEQDYRKAAGWYEKAVDEGNPFAAYALGSLYRRGQGVEKDEAQAAAYFQAAAAHGNEYAKRLLESLHTPANGQSWSVTSSAFTLMRQTAGIFQERLRELDSQHTHKGEKRCNFANFMDCKKANTFDDVIIDYTLRSGSYRNTFDKRLSAKVCELCGKTNIPLEIHHVNKVKNLKGKEKWEKIMIAKRRKTLAVCRECHYHIHNP